MSCPFCNHIENKKSYLPSTKFNNKIFHYLSCAKCELIYTTPIPTLEDFEKMYPPSYQNGADTKILTNQYKKLIGLRFSYGYQFDLLKKFNYNGIILDYGCGTGNFIANASNQGFECVGAEYNLKHVESLKKAMPNDFYLVDEVLSGKTGKFDIIRLSNVLEHLPEPREVIDKLTPQLNKGGILLFEGPIETNPSLALMTRKFYFNLRKKLKPKWKANHVPTHMFFSNRKNQLHFFKHFELETLHYKIKEAEWPYPASVLGAQGFGGKLKAIIAKVSIGLNYLNKNWGNTFIYVGRKK